MIQLQWIKTTAVGLSFSAMTSFAMASGSDAVGSAQTGDAAAYSMGKRVYAVKVACKRCPMAGKKLNKETAKKLLMSGTGTELTAREERALKTYLQRRFKL